MKLFVWERKDYHEGFAVALAESEDQARELVAQAIGYGVDDVEGDPKVFPVDEAIAFHVPGEH